MELSDIGLIVADEWQKTPQIRSNVKLNEWVIMPNHLHGIIIIDIIDNYVHSPATEQTFRRNVSSDNVLIRGENHNQPSRLKSNSLGSIIGQFKSVCTKQIWKSGYTNFRWQPRFYDIIIRNEQSLRNIQQYIINNPKKWQLDRHNS